MSGKDLIDGMIVGDDRSWRLFITETGPIVRSLSLKSGLNEDEMKDIGQSVVLKLLENNCCVLRRLDYREQSFFGWIKVIISRQIIDYIREREGRIKRESGWTVDNDRIPTRTSIAAEKIELKVSVESASEQLSPEDLMLYKFCVRDVPDFEIARILDLSLNAVQQRMSRMRKRLKTILESMKLPGTN
ncbi:MAG: sigma-70 family RNA polymerase sigma factor [bacterium]